MQNYRRAPGRRVWLAVAVVGALASPVVPSGWPKAAVITAVGVASGMLAARLGGDEFAVLIQDVTPAQGDAVTAELDEQTDEVARLGADIRNAIDSGQFRLAYQPIVELPHGRTAGVEALIRWEHPVSRSTSSRWTSPSWTPSRWPAGTPSSPRR